MGLPTVHLETDFSRPVDHGDDMEVGVSVLKVGNASITFGYRVFKKGDAEPRIVGHNVTVCINMDKFEKIEIPEWFREKLARQIGKDEHS